MNEMQFHIPSVIFHSLFFLFRRAQSVNDLIVVAII